MLVTSSEYADVELIVACGVVLERMDWPNPCLPTSQQGRDNSQGENTGPWKRRLGANRVGLCTFIQDLMGSDMSFMSWMFKGPWGGPHLCQAGQPQRARSCLCLCARR